MIEKQVIVTWHEPSEKLPPNDDFVAVTISGEGPNVTYDHALMIGSWDEDGWLIEGIDADTTEFVVHAWCDLEPYGGGK